MKRVLAVISLVFLVMFFVVACGKEKKDVADRCKSASPPVGCNVECSVDVANTCAPGLYCDPKAPGDYRGTCKSQCAQNGKECGSDATCSAQGRCYKSSLVFKILDFPATK